jgi:predicted metal-binding membrane protein
MNVGWENELVEKRFVAARDRGFLTASGLVFLAAASATIYWTRSMSGGMMMPGGWTMSTAWMRMYGENRLEAGASFLGMWIVMMIAMMLPSLLPALSRYRRAVRESTVGSIERLTALVAAGYFFMWTAIGAALYPLGVVMAETAMRWPAFSMMAPILWGVIVLLAGCFQLTGWKVCLLDRCTNVSMSGHQVLTSAQAAWRHGIRLGVNCSLCCAGLMLILIALGVMNVGAMAAVAAVIMLERFSKRPQWVARTVGVVAAMAGILLVTQALLALLSGHG